MCLYIKLLNYRGCGKVVLPNEAIVSLVLKLVCNRAFSCRRRTLSIGNLGLPRRFLALSLVRFSNKASEFIFSSLGKKSTGKNSHQNFTRQRYMLSFKGGTSLLRETVTILRSRAVIHRGHASFWYMMHIYCLVKQF